jgi:hypothetical protein
MAIDRAGARRRVATITGWAAAGAAALTAGFAFGAARGSQAATHQPSQPSSHTQEQQSPHDGQNDGIPYQGTQPYTPPSASSGPPAGMSGGS